MVYHIPLWITFPLGTISLLYTTPPRSPQMHHITSWVQTHSIVQGNSAPRRLQAPWWVTDEYPRVAGHLSSPPVTFQGTNRYSTLVYHSSRCDKFHSRPKQQQGAKPARRCRNQTHPSQGSSDLPAADCFPLLAEGVASASPFPVPCRHTLHTRHTHQRHIGDCRHMWVGSHRICTVV